FSLRESTPLSLWATRAVHRGLEGNTMLRTLQRFPGHLTQHVLEIDHPIELPGTCVTVTPIPLPGKVPKHLEGLAPPSPEDNTGLVIHDETTGGCAVIATAAGSTGDYVSRLEGADVVFFDGTFWSSDELVALGLGTARAEDMAHLPVGG